MDDAHQNGSRLVLERFLCFILRDGPIYIYLATSATVTLLPSGYVQGTDFVKFCIKLDLTMDFQELFRVDGPDQGRLKAWRDGLASHSLLDADAIVLSLLSAMFTTLHSRQTRKLFSLQVMWALGRKLDDVFRRMHGGASSFFDESRIVGDFGDEDRSHIAAAYAQQQVQVVAGSGGQFRSGCGDHSIVLNYNLFSGIVALPDNTVFWCVPQDPPPGYRACALLERGVPITRKNILYVRRNEDMLV